MSDFTPRANLRLPGGGSTGTILPDEQVDIDVLNDNFRKIDALLGARNIPSASSYAGSMNGDLVYAHDTGFLHMFSANAGGLITPRLPGARQYSGTAAERVAFAPQAKGGDLWRDTDNIGVIWVYKAGSPGTWEYTGNPLRGTKAAMDQLVTDGRAVVGMVAYCIDDKKEYVKLTNGWIVNGEILRVEDTAAVVSGVALHAALTDLPEGAVLEVRASGIGISGAAGAGAQVYLRNTTDGTAVTATSPVVDSVRTAGQLSGSGVQTAVPNFGLVTVTATKKLNFGVTSSAAIYAPDKRVLTVRLHKVT